jgi:hypothetical protein
LSSERSKRIEIKAAWQSQLTIKLEIASRGLDMAKEPCLLDHRSQ